MKSSIINFKVDRILKHKAQRKAAALGLSLGSVLNTYLKKFIKAKSIEFVAEEPSNYLKKIIRAAEQDAKSGRLVVFDSLDEELAYLDRIIAHDEKAGKN